MRIAELRLLRYGPFRDVALTFGSGRGLHVVYGDNEAGKSTSLRAIRALLFGIAAKSPPDAHRFKPGELAVGATLETAAGTLVVERRKGKGGLLDARGAPLDEAVLAEALGGVDGDTHALMFSLDHQSLRDGGEALLEGRGDAARALFQAHTGHGRFLRAVETLAGERDELFTERGRNRKPLSAAIAAYFDAERQMREHELAQPAYEKQLDAIRESRVERAQLGKRREELEAERGRLAVVERARALVAERARLVEQRDKMPLPPSTVRAEVQAWSAAVADEAQAASALESARAARSDAERELAAIEFSQALVAAKTRVTALERRLGAARDAATRAFELSAKLRDAETRLATLAERAPRDFVACDEVTLARGLGAVDGVHGAERSLRDLTTRLEAAESACERARAMRDQVQPQSSPPPPPDAAAEPRRRTKASAASAAASARAERAQGAGPLGESGLRALADRLNAELRDARALEQMSDRVERELRESARLRAEIGFSDEHATARRIPDAAQVAAWSVALTRHAEEQRRIDVERLAVERRAVLADAELARLDREGAVPREEELLALRAERDASIEAIGSKPAALAAAREAVTAADAFADRMRRESDRVAAHARVRAERDAARAELQVLVEAIARAEHGRAAVTAAVAVFAPWLGAWLRDASSVDAAALEARVQKARRACEVADAAAAHASECAASAKRVSAACDAVAAELPGAATGVAAPAAGEQMEILGLGLGEAIARGEALALAALREAERRAEEKIRTARLDDERRRAEADIAALGADAARLAASVTAARAELALRIAEVPFLREGALESVDSVAAHARDVQAAGRDVERLRGELAVATQTVAAFAADARALARDVGYATLAADTSGDAEDAATFAEGLIAAFARDAALAARAAHAETVAKAARLDVAKNEETLARVAEPLNAAYALARVGTPAELSRVVAASEAWLDVSEAIEAVEEKLVAHGQGRSVEEVVALCHALSAIDVAARAARVQEEHEDTEARISALDRSIGGQEAGLPKFLESGAMVSATIAEAELEKVRDLTLAYARRLVVTVAARGAMDRFREGRAERIVTRAGEILARVTSGSLAGFTTTTDDDDVVRLAAVRADGHSAAMAELSDGTRDAVFFALRVACLELLADTRDLPPVVLDDALVHFDDDRARAALRVLGALSERVQVLFFTHHARLVDLAREASQDVVVHRLDRRDGPAPEATAN